MHGFLENPNFVNHIENWNFICLARKLGLDQALNPKHQNTPILTDFNCYWKDSSWYACFLHLYYYYNIFQENQGTLYS
jgi:hypothetical protein